MDYANNNDIIVTFTLLDRPPPIGDVLKPKQEPSLDTVASLILKAINNGTFKVSLTAAGSQTVSRNINTWAQSFKTNDVVS